MVWPSAYHRQAHVSSQGRRVTDLCGEHVTHPGWSVRRAADDGRLTLEERAVRDRRGDVPGRGLARRRERLVPATVNHASHQDDQHQPPVGGRRYVGLAIGVGDARPLGHVTGERVVRQRAVPAEPQLDRYAGRRAPAVADRVVPLDRVRRGDRVVDECVSDAPDAGDDAAVVHRVRLDAGTRAARVGQPHPVEERDRVQVAVATVRHRDLHDLRTTGEVERDPRQCARVVTLFNAVASASHGSSAVPGSGSKGSPGWCQ